MGFIQPLGLIQPGCKSSQAAVRHLQIICQPIKKPKDACRLPDQILRTAHICPVNFAIDGADADLVLVNCGNPAPIAKIRTDGIAIFLRKQRLNRRAQSVNIYSIEWAQPGKSF